MADYVPIDDPNDPRLSDTPLNPPEFDPQAYGGDTATETAAPPVWDPSTYANEEKKPKQAEPKALPTRTPNVSTFYFPSTPDVQLAAGLDPKMEGGPFGAGNFSKLELRNHTLEEFIAGKSDFVAVAMKGEPTGELFQTTIKGNPVTAKWVDTGGGLKEGQMDFATSNPELARTGIDRPWNPDHYAQGKPQPVPDVSAFLEPAPADDTTEAEQAAQESPTEAFGKALARGVQGAAEAIGRLGTPKEIKLAQLQSPQMQIPQTPSLQGNVIPSQGMIGQAIPTPPQATPQVVAPPAPPEAVPSYFRAKAGVYPQQAVEMAPGAQIPVVAGSTEGLSQTAQGLIPHTMEQFHSLAQVMGAPTDPQGFFMSALKQGLVTADTAQKAIKAGPLSKEAGVAYGTIIPQALMMMGGLGEAAALPNVGPIVSSITGRNILPRAQESGAVGATGGPKPAAQQAPIVQPAQQQGLPFKPASVQGLKTGPPSPKYSRGAAPPKPPAGAPPPPPTGGAPPPPPAGGVPPVPPQTPQQLLSQRQVVKGISQKHDSVFTRADYDARQKVNPLRQEFDQDVMGSSKSAKNIQAAKDLEAATFIAEASGNKLALKHDLDLVRNSKNKKLAKKYAPKLQYALDNFDRISKIQNRYEKLMADQLAEDAAAGITYGEREGYVTHVFKDQPENTLLSFMTGGGTGAGGFSKYFTKNRQFNSLAEAINAGVEPTSVNLADLAQHRISASRKLIIQKSVFNELNQMHLPDGQPVVKGIGHYQDANGNWHMNVPKGYELIRANGIDLAVHPGVSHVFKALYGDSALRRTKVGRAVMKTAAVEKAYTLAVDTFHGFRGIMKNLFYGGKNSRLGYEKGLTVYELSNEALDTSVKRGEITQKQADWAKSARPNIEAMMKHGLNASRFSDNLVSQMHVTFPGARGVNDWIFKRVFRGAMLQAADANFQRNLSRFPELSRDQVAQRTVTEMNEVFGNLGSQGLFRDKTTRDLLNLTFLAPQWVESQARAEFRGYGQAAKIIPDAVQGKFRVGVVAQGQATAVAAYLIGNQIINYATTGHSTFENEGIHKLDAFLPFGDRGVYIDPLALSAEYVDQVIRVMDRQGDKATIPSVVSEIASHKLSGIGRAAVTVSTQRDWRGRKLESTWDVTKEAASNLLPVPIFTKGVTSGFELDPNSPVGFSYSPQWDQIAQQLLMSTGQKALLGPSQGQYPGAPLRIQPGEGGDIERPKRGSKQSGGVI